eukprot:Partr_v1_DN24740_c0_g1_i1_m37241 putative Positively regulates the activity of the minus-end directed microtubule motor protein dynein. May enhance dynein- mediated microtubule sliding by targeting dynein to the microtubule plus end. Required for
MSLLTPKQKDELHAAILEYMQSNSTFSPGLVESFAKEAQIDSSNSTGPSMLLEKKWTSVIRLQRKLMELEQKLAIAQEELARAPSSSSAGRRAQAAGSHQLIPRAPERLSLKGHRAPITALSFHPVFSVIASASEDASIKIWDYESGELERTLKGHTKAVHSLAYDSSGRHLISCSADLSIKVWNVEEEYKCIRTLLGHDHSVSDLAFIPNNSPGNQEQYLISASRDKSLRVWELATGYCTRTMTGHAEWVRSVRLDESGTHAVTASNDQTVGVWDVASGDLKCQLRGHEHVVEFALFVPLIAHSSVRELTGTVAAAGKDDTQTLVISASRDKTLKLWDISTATCIHTFSGHDNWVRSVEFLVSAPTPKSPQSLAYLVSVSDDKSLKVWDLKTGRCTRTIPTAHNHFVSCVQVRYNSSTAIVATGSVDQEVRIWSSSPS